MGNGCNHSLAASLVDVPGIDAASVDFGDCPCQGMLLNTRSQLGAPVGRELFRVVETNDAAPGIENDGGGYDGTEEGTPACFVEPGDALPTSLPSFALVSGAAEPSHRVRF